MRESERQRQVVYGPVLSPKPMNWFNSFIGGTNGSVHISWSGGHERRLGVEGDTFNIYSFHFYLVYFCLVHF